MFLPCFRSKSTMPNCNSLRVFEELIRYNESALKHRVGADWATRRRIMGMVQTLPCSRQDRSVLAAGVTGRTAGTGFSAQKEDNYSGRTTLQRGSQSREPGIKIIHESLEFGYLGRWGFSLREEIAQI